MDFKKLHKSYFSFPYSHQLPSSQAQVISQQHNPMRPQTKFSARQRPTNVQSFQFQPLAQRGVPLFYPQQTAIMTDPNWYYNNMMLYQVYIDNSTVQQLELYPSYTA